MWVFLYHVVGFSLFLCVLNGSIRLLSLFFPSTFRLINLLASCILIVSSFDTMTKLLCNQ